MSFEFDEEVRGNTRLVKFGETFGAPSTRTRSGGKFVTAWLGPTSVFEFALALLHIDASVDCVSETHFTWRKRNTRYLLAFIVGSQKREARTDDNDNKKKQTR